jgi:hypothetical protein
MDGFGLSDLAAEQPATKRKYPPQHVLLRVNHTHHLTAQLMASGTVSQVEVSRRTGYTPTYISKIKKDPEFQKLLAYYEGKVEQEYVNGLERMQVLGLAVLDELQARLEADPEEWTNRELIELAELLLIKQKVTGGRRETPPQGGVQFNIRFVTAKSSLRPDAKVIDQVDKSPKQEASAIDIVPQVVSPEVAKLQERLELARAELARLKTLPFQDSRGLSGRR